MFSPTSENPSIDHLMDMHGSKSTVTKDKIDFNLNLGKYSVIYQMIGPCSHKMSQSKNFHAIASLMKSKQTSNLWAMIYPITQLRFCMVLDFFFPHLRDWVSLIISLLWTEITDLG